MCALFVSNSEAEGLLFCLHSVSGYLTSQATSYRSREEGGLLAVRWRVIEAEVAYLLLPLIALVEAAIRFAIGCVAACFGKGKTPFMRDLAWVGAAVCLDAGLRALVALVKNVREEKLTYEDLLLNPLFVIEPEVAREQQAAQAADDAARVREFAQQPKGVFTEEVEDACIEGDEEGSIEDLFVAIEGNFPEINRHLGELCIQLEKGLLKSVEQSLLICQKLFALGGEHIHEECRQKYLAVIAKFSRAA